MAQADYPEPENPLRRLAEEIRVWREEALRGPGGIDDFVLVAYVSGQLDDAERKRVEERLAASPELAEIVQIVRETLQEGDWLREPPAPEPHLRPPLLLAAREISGLEEPSEQQTPGPPGPPEQARLEFSGRFLRIERGLSLGGGAPAHRGFVTAREVSGREEIPQPRAIAPPSWSGEDVPFVTVADAPSSPPPLVSCGQVQLSERRWSRSRVGRWVAVAAAVAAAAAIVAGALCLFRSGPPPIQAYHHPPKEPRDQQFSPTGPRDVEQCGPPSPPAGEDLTVSPALCKAIARWDRIEEPIVEQYLTRLRDIFRGSGFRLVEFDKANWKFEISLPEQPEPRGGFVLAQVAGEVRLARDQAGPGSVTRIVPLPTQRLFVPWYYVFPYARGARVLSQRLMSASFEFSKEGGKVSFGGQEFEIPAGAVPDGTLVTLHYLYEDARHPQRANLLHCVKVDVEPASVVFAKPATLRLVSGRVPGSALLLQSCVARRGARLTGPAGIAAILPGGRIEWTEGQHETPCRWDPARGIPAWDSVPEPGWRVMKIREEIEAHKTGRVLDFLFVPGPDLEEVLKAALRGAPPVPVSIISEGQASGPQSRKLGLAACLSGADPLGDLRDAKPMRGPAPDVPPTIEATLTCRTATASDGVAADLTAQIHRMPLETVVYRLREAQVSTGISFTITGPGVYSVTCEADTPQGPASPK